MTIHVNWGTADQRALHLTFERGWTWDDLQTAIAQADTFIVAAEHTVHLIIDIRHSGGLPRDFLSGAGELFAQGDARSNEGQRIVVGAGMMIRAAYKSVMALYGAQLAARPFVFASSLEDAHQMIATI